MAYEPLNRSRRSWHNCHIVTFPTLVRDRLREMSVSAISAAQRAGLNRDAIRSVLRGRSPSVDRAAEICRALGLEFYVGPPRKPSRSAQATSSEGAEGETQKLLDVLNAAADRLSDIRDYVEVPVYSEEITSFSPHLNRVAECTFPYRTSWLERYGVDPKRCFMVRLRGEQMAPTLPDKCFVLVNEAATELRDGGVFVVRHRKRIMVRRAEKSRNGWWLKNDGERRWKQRWTVGAQVFGEIVWMARHIQMPRLEEPAATTHELARTFTTLPSHRPLYIQRLPEDDEERTKL